MQNAPLDRTIAPAIHTIKNFHLVKPEMEILSNGLVWNHIEAGTQAAISIQFIFRAGTWFAPSREVAAFTARMLNEGTSSKNSSQIAEEIDKYGSYLDIASGNDYATIELYSLTKYLKPMLELMQEILTEATFPEHELQKVKDINIQNIKINNEKVAVTASQRLKMLLFGESSKYGSDITIENIETLSRQSLVDFYQQNFYQQPFNILTAGHLTVEEKNSLRTMLEAMPVAHKQSPLSPAQMTITAKRGQLYLAKDGAMQTAIRMAKPLFLRTHEDFVPMRVLTEILGGYFGSRLMANIREEKGYTYGINASMQFSRNAGHLLIGTDVKKEVREETISEIHKEIKILREEKVGKEELTMVKNYMKGVFVNSLHTPFAIAEKYRNIYLFDLPTDYYQNYLEAINNVTAKQVQEMANKYLAGDYVEVMVG
jgi:predicted Zn-dependent peptidase